MPETLEELIAQGRCTDCGTFGGIWHKLGCSFDIRTPREPAPDLDVERAEIVDLLPHTD